MRECGHCQHWRPDTPLACYGFGRCQARPEPALREGMHTSRVNVCRTGNFSPLQPPKPAQS